MPKFYGQNKKRIDPRYFLNETIEEGDRPPWEDPNQASRNPMHRAKDLASQGMEDAAQRTLGLFDGALEDGPRRARSQTRDTQRVYRDIFPLPRAETTRRRRGTRCNPADARSILVIAGRDSDHVVEHRDRMRVDRIIGQVVVMSTHRVRPVVVSNGATDHLEVVPRRDRTFL